MQQRRPVQIQLNVPTDQNVIKTFSDTGFASNSPSFGRMVMFTSNEVRWVGLRLC